MTKYESLLWKYIVPPVFFLAKLKYFAVLGQPSGRVLHTRSV